MQEWLKDKKNLPIVGTVGAVVLIGAIVLMLFETGVLPPQPAPVPVAASSTSAAPPLAPGVVKPGGAPGSFTPPPMPYASATHGGIAPRTMPGTVPTQASAAGAAAAKTPTPPLNAAKGPDPFKVPGYRPFHVSTALLNALRVRNAVPAVYIQQYTSRDKLLPGLTRGKRRQPLGSLIPEVSSSMRMSGVITSDNSIKALLESNGVSTQVQPGDTVDGGKVLSIQPDGLTLRTSDNRLVRVPLSGTPTAGNSPYGGGGGFPPNGAPGFIPPGGGPGFIPPGGDPNGPQQ